MKMFAAVAAGGAIGSAARYSFGLAFASHTAGWTAGWPYGTLICNLLGSLLLGWLNGLASVKAVNPVWKEGIGTGLIGGYTTFSALSVETIELLREGKYGSAAGYIGVSIAGGMLLAAIGMLLARRSAGRRQSL